MCCFFAAMQLSVKYNIAHMRNVEQAEGWKSSKKKTQKITQISPYFKVGILVFLFGWLTLLLYDTVTWVILTAASPFYTTTISWQRA